MERGNMRLSARFGFFAILGGALIAGTSAKAEQVTFITTGTFSGGTTPGTSTYTDPTHGIVINYVSSTDNSANVPPTSQVSFGTFSTQGTTATDFAGILGTFTLTIIQTSGDGGELNFASTLNGELRIDNSQAFVQFTGPLSQNLGPIFYEIASSDDTTPGRVNLAPPTTNNGEATITGRVGVVPEPASLAMVAMGGASLLAAARRKRAKAPVTA